MTDSQLFLDLFHQHHFKGSTRELRVVRGGYTFVEARQRLGFRIGSVKALDLNAMMRPNYVKVDHPLMVVGIPKGHVLDAFEVFNAWMRIVPVVGIPENCLVRTKKRDLVIACYVYGPFQRAARKLWKELLAELQDSRR